MVSNREKIEIKLRFLFHSTVIETNEVHEHIQTRRVSSLITPVETDV